METAKKEFKGTKGKWVMGTLYGPNKKIKSIHVNANADHERVLPTRVGYINGPWDYLGENTSVLEAEANAQLWASSKLLLKALQDVVERFDGYFGEDTLGQESIDNAKSAISSALGE